MAEAIKEEDGVHKKWFEEAREMTAEKLPEFIRKLTHDYEHDYGTICHAIAAAAVAAAWAVERSPSGGITGFQAGAVMWSFMEHWNSIKGPARLIQYDDLLYPQYEHKFTAISPDTWEHVRKEAEKLIAERSAETVHPDVFMHWQSVAKGQIPFGLRVEH